MGSRSSRPRILPQSSRRGERGHSALTQLQPMLAPGNMAVSPAPTPSQGLVRGTPAAIMAGSRLFQDYRRAFVSASGMELELRSPPSGSRSDLAAESADSPCARLGPGPRSCAMCLIFHQKIAVAAQQAAHTLECRAGLCETVVPVRTGKRVVALLQIGPVRLRAPTDNDVARIVRLLPGSVSDVVAGQVKTALRQIRHIAPEQYASLVQLLEIFSRQLAEWYVRHAPTKRSPEPLTILRAQEWIETHYHETLTLSKMAKVAQMSPWHFSRSFHQATGTTFMMFLCRMRMTHVCQLLADPRNTIGESAFAVGFRSISQFNRTFHREVGQSPTEYRTALDARKSTGLGAAKKSQALASPLSHHSAA